MSANHPFPDDFLARKVSDIKVHKVDWQKTDIPEYAGCHAVVLDNVLTRDECTQLLRAAVSHADGKWEQALVNVGNYQQSLNTDIRNSSRIIWDDRVIVERLLHRIRTHLAEIESLTGRPEVTGQGPTKRKETWVISRLNERMRFLRYGAGQYFRRHTDGTYQTPDQLEMTFYTLHLYLNEVDASDPNGELKGGATTFHSPDGRRSYKVEPKIGRVLVFQHRRLLHSGEEVKAGLKYTMRTDLLYKKAEG